LYTFGWNQHGQLGVGEEDAGILHLVHFPSLDNDPTKDDNLLVSTVDVACGQAHTIAVREDGSVWSCGWGKLSFSMYAHTGFTIII
jgi:alpha-tubulin suppressor-like RCC1 family protein